MKPKKPTLANPFTMALFSIHNGPKIPSGRY